MPRQRRSFTAKFKSDLVFELLKGEKSLNVLAAENHIRPDLLRNWKSQFLEKAVFVFDASREKNIHEEQRATTDYARQAKKLTGQSAWLEKQSVEIPESEYESIFSPESVEE